MKRMQEFDREDYGVLLASDKIDASKGVLFGTGDGMIPPDTHGRTILIGMGGTGIKTINHIKGSIERKLDPSWKKYVVFLGIDADRTEFNRASHLNPDETVTTTLPDVAWRAQTEAYYPRAWRTFADPNQVIHLSNLGGDGSGRSRLMGRMKIHDHEAGAKGVDQQIVEKLATAKTKLAPIIGNQKYEVYVIGSVCGGTCSGGFLEMPALIRKALGKVSVQIHAMLYLPDTVTALDPDHKDELEANGYASLKELNYYQGISMRKDYSESWGYNDPADPELRISAHDDFFQMPYLVGTSDGPAQDSMKVAQETIAEFFVSILGDVSTGNQDAFLVSSFLNNAAQRTNSKLASAGNPEVEAPDALHEFPKRFGAIGFASAAAPEEIVQAYTIDRACATAGLQPVDAATKASLLAKGEKFLPFMGEKDFLTAKDGTAKAEKIVEPLVGFVAAFQKVQFNFLTDLTVSEVTWDDVRAGKYDNQTIRIQMEKWIADKTGEDAKRTLDSDLMAAFAKFKENIVNYVKEYGPLAFYNLYQGSFIPENNEPGVGVKEMIARIRNSRDPKTGKDRPYKSAADAQTEIAKAKSVIADTKALKAFFGDKKKEQLNAWITANNTWVNLSVNEKRREHLLGNNKRVHELFEKPAEILADQLRTFGYILDRLASTYHAHGQKLLNYDQFQGVSDFATEVNIAAVNTHAHAWLVDHAEQIAGQINGRKVRNNLVDSFFADPDKWLLFPDEMVTTTEAGVMLADPDLAVPARQTFDKVMAETIGVNTTISVETLFNQVQQRNVSYDQYAQQIIAELELRSKLLFDGKVGDSVHRYIMYPQTLVTSNPAIVNAIQQAATTKFPGIGFYGSAYADSIMMYQLAAPFEVYRLNALASWEQQYDVKMAGTNGLHGRSPDLEMTVDAAGTTHYKGLTKWHDYPSIVFAKDPTKKDPQTGKRSHEGEVRLEIDKLLDEARELGVLYGKQENGKWTFYRVHCDKSRDWTFDDSLMRPDKETGLLPIGEALVKAIAEQNESSVADMSRAVELHDGGLMNQPHSTEDWAWTYAKRVLYVHRPMLIEIRETVKLFRDWAKKIKEANAKIMAKWKPAKMIRMMQGGILTPDEDGYWNLEGSSMAVANLSESGISILDMRFPQEAPFVHNGFILYYIYKSLIKRKDMDGDGMDKALARAKEEIAAWNDPEVMEECFKRVDKMLKEETEKLVKLGANLEEPEKKPLRSFVEKMEELDIDESSLSDLCMFYKMAKLWKKV